VQLYDQLAVAELTLFNTGRVGFDFIGIGMDPCFETNPKPGVAIMMPHMVSILSSVLLFLSTVGSTKHVFQGFFSGFFLYVKRLSV